MHPLAAHVVREVCVRVVAVVVLAVSENVPRGGVESCKLVAACNS